MFDIFFLHIKSFKLQSVVFISPSWFCHIWGSCTCHKQAWCTLDFLFCWFMHLFFILDMHSNICENYADIAIVWEICRFSYWEAWTREAKSTSYHKGILFTYNWWCVSIYVRSEFEVPSIHWASNNEQLIWYQKSSFLVAEGAYRFFKRIQYFLLVKKLNWLNLHMLSQIYLIPYSKDWFVFV